MTILPSPLTQIACKVKVASINLLVLSIQLPIPSQASINPTTSLHDSRTHVLMRE